MKKPTIAQRLEYLEHREKILTERIGDTSTSIDEMFVSMYNSILHRRSPRISLTEELRLIRQHLGLKVEHTDAAHKLVKVKKEKRA